MNIQHIILEDEPQIALNMLEAIGHQHSVHWLDPGRYQPARMKRNILRWKKADGLQTEVYARQFIEWKPTATNIRTPCSTLSLVEKSIRTIEGNAILYLDVKLGLKGLSLPKSEEEESGKHLIPIVLEFLNHEAPRLICVTTTAARFNFRPFLETAVREAGFSPEKALFFPREPYDGKDYTLARRQIDKTLQHYRENLARVHELPYINAWVNLYREPWADPRKFKKYIWYIDSDTDNYKGDTDNHTDKFGFWRDLLGEKLPAFKSAGAGSGKALMQFHSNPICTDRHTISAEVLLAVLSDLGFAVEKKTSQTDIRLPQEPGLPWLLAIARLRDTLFNNQEEKKTGWGEKCINDGDGWNHREWPITINLQKTSWVLSMRTSLKNEAIVLKSSGDLQVAIENVKKAEVDGLDKPSEIADDSYWAVFRGTPNPCCEVIHDQRGLITVKWSAV